jgi:hypothetical protein
MKRSWMYPVLLSRNRELTLVSAPRTAMQYGVGCDLMSERPRGTLAVSAQAPAPRQRQYRKSMVKTVIWNHNISSKVVKNSVFKLRSKCLEFY